MFITSKVMLITGKVMLITSKVMFITGKVMLITSKVMFITGKVMLITSKVMHLLISHCLYFHNLLCTKLDDVRDTGCHSDGGVLANSSFGQALEERSLQFPELCGLPG